MVGISAMGCLMLLVVGEPALRLLIGHGGITASSVHSLWWIMIALLGVLVGGTVGQVIAVAFYAMGDTKTPTNLFIVTFTIYIPIKVLAFFHYGLMGLAVATSFHQIVNLLLQLVILERVTSPTRAAALRVR